MKKLIINADDFGLAKGINLAIIKCYRKGIVTSASLMSNGKYFMDAIRLVKDNPRLDLGIHLTLVEEKPILSKDEIPSLLNKRDYFHDNYFEFFKKYIAGKIKKHQIEKELRAQIEKCLKENIKLTHIDSHQYIHFFPPIFNIVIKLAKKYNIPFIRRPYKPINIKDIRYLRFFFQIFFNTFSRIYQRKIKESGILNTQYFFGFIQSAKLNSKIVEDLLKTIKTGVTELVCHPGILDKELKRTYMHWKYNWQKEFNIFSSQEIKNSLNKYQIELISFKDLL